MRYNNQKSIGCSELFSIWVSDPLKNPYGFNNFIQRQIVTYTYVSSPKPKSFNFDTFNIQRHY